MKKKLTLREWILLLLLVVILLFYFLSQGPIERITGSVNEQKANVQSQIDQLTPYISQMNAWQDELNEIYEKYDGNPKSIPEYNNINSVIAEMSVIFDGDSTYSINFSEPSIADHIATRSISISFSCEGYKEAIAKLNAINNSDNRYRITDMSISEIGGDDSCSISLSLLAYEYYED